jgi:hypothetical protein
MRAPARRGGEGVHEIRLSRACLEHIVDELRDRYGIAVGTTFTDTNPPQALMDVRAKQIFRSGGTPAVLGQLNVSAQEVVAQVEAEAICDDLKTFLADVSALV